MAAASAVTWAESGDISGTTSASMPSARMLASIECAVRTTPALLGTSIAVTMPRSAAQQASSSAATFFPTPVGALSIRVGPARRVHV